jgi:tellurite resistance protein TerC
MRDRIRTMLRTTRTVLVVVAGASVLLVGVAMIVLPGPAFVVIPAGLAILGIEFAWARRWLAELRRRGDQALGALRERRPR